MFVGVTGLLWQLLIGMVPRPGWWDRAVQTAWPVRRFLFAENGCLLAGSHLGQA